MSRRRPPRSEDSTEPRCQTELPRPEAWEEVRPEVATICEEIGIVRPSKQRWLQRKYDRFMESAQTDWDFGGYVLTFILKAGEVARSVPVDRAVGELVAGRL